MRRKKNIFPKKFNNNYNSIKQNNKNVEILTLSHQLEPNQSINQSTKLAKFFHPLVGDNGTIIIIIIITIIMRF